MGWSTTTSLLLLLLAAGCGDDVGACDKQRDVSGSWTFSLEGGDLPRSTNVQATLRQVRPPGTFSLGRFLYGTLVADDPGFFDPLTIPELMKNNGSKTGSMLGCVLKINVPIAEPVTDDNEDQGPLRISLGGTVTAAGMMVGNPEMSSVVMKDDPTMTPRAFSWSGSPSR